MMRTSWLITARKPARRRGQTSLFFNLAAPSSSWTIIRYLGTLLTKIHQLQAAAKQLLLLAGCHQTKKYAETIIHAHTQNFQPIQVWQCPMQAYLQAFKVADTGTIPLWKGLCVLGRHWFTGALTFFFRTEAGKCVTYSRRPPSCDQCGCTSTGVGFKSPRNNTDNAALNLKSTPLQQHERRLCREHVTTPTIHSKYAWARSLIDRTHVD
eukprot:520189-Pelagomonas_calceolata.AAC.4